MFGSPRSALDPERAEAIIDATGGVIGHAASYAFAASTGRSSYSGMIATASISTSAPGRACPAVETTVIAVR